VANNNLNRRPINGVGVLFCAANTGRHLFLLRNDKSSQVWGLPGGKVERDETLLDALERECREEINWWPENAKLFPIEQFTSEDTKFVYHTFYSLIDAEFMPILNDEHIGYSWIDGNTYPRPLHRGLFSTLNYDIIKQKISIIRSALK
jgi:ADP-ribose pyrophosphatase YjhB (NUDIX family)